MVAVRAAKAKARQHRLEARRLSDLRFRVLASCRLDPFGLEPDSHLCRAGNYTCYVGQKRPFTPERVLLSAPPLSLRAQRVGIAASSAYDILSMSLLL
jgi:hypothetical protein